MHVTLKKQVRDQAWTLMEVYAPITTVVRSSNRKRTNTEAGWLKATMGSALPADVPLLRVDMPRTTSSGFGSGVNSSGFKLDAFDQEDIDFPTHGNCQIDWQFTLQITLWGDVKKIDEQDQLADDVIMCMLLAGPKFGLDFIVNSNPITSQQGEVADAGGIRRLRTIISIPFNATLDFQALRTLALS